MPELVVDIPVRQVYLRESFMSPVRDSLVPAVVFSATSVPGRALGFQVMTSFGAVVDRLPISALAHDGVNLGPGLAPAFLAHDILQLWDCPSRGVVAHEYDHLSQLRCTVTLKDGHKYQGTYWFTFDWFGSSYADDAGELGHKSGHVIALDCGAFAIQPNSRIRWFEPAFVVDDWPESLEWDTIDEEYRCEQTGRWQTENTNRWDYDVVENHGAAGAPRVWNRALSDREVKDFDIADGLGETLRAAGVDKLPPAKGGLVGVGAFAVDALLKQDDQRQPRDWARVLDAAGLRYHEGRVDPGFVAEMRRTLEMEMG